jgi:two-component sensor histidine kinase
MSLVLHELATNALKYGALSANDGRIAITWNLSYDERSARVLTLLWRERGGPPVLPPTREGFGTRLLTRSFAQVGGSAVVHYEPEGLSCLLEFSLSAAEEIPGPDARYLSPQGAARPAPPAAAAPPGHKHPPQGRSS